DRDVVGLERQLERSRERLARDRETSRRGPGDVEEYRRLSNALDAERRTRRGAGQTADAMERLRPGDVLVRGGRPGRVAGLVPRRSPPGAPRVLRPPAGRGPRPAGGDPLSPAPPPGGQIELPVPLPPRANAV